MAVSVSNKKEFFYEDYIKLNSEDRVEIIDGHIYNMAPAPSRIHQKISFKVATMIENYITSKNGECEVYVAPFDVRLIDESEKEEKVKNIVQPDISVICDKNKLDSKGCLGTPDFILEVVSPSNSSIDYVKKLFLYEKFKVKEYWIVNPMTQNILVYRLGENNGYSEPERYTLNDIVKVQIFSDLEINFKTILKGTYS